MRTPSASSGCAARRARRVRARPVRVLGVDRRVQHAVLHLDAHLDAARARAASARGATCRCRRRRGPAAAQQTEKLFGGRRGRGGAVTRWRPALTPRRVGAWRRSPATAASGRLHGRRCGAGVAGAAPGRSTRRLGLAGSPLEGGDDGRVSVLAESWRRRVGAAAGATGATGRRVGAAVRGRRRGGQVAARRRVVAEGWSGLGRGVARPRAVGRGRCRVWAGSVGRPTVLSKRWSSGSTGAGRRGADWRLRCRSWGRRGSGVGGRARVGCRGGHVLLGVAWVSRGRVVGWSAARLRSPLGHVVGPPPACRARRRSRGGLATGAVSVSAGSAGRSPPSRQREVMRDSSGRGGRRPGRRPVGLRRGELRWRVRRAGGLRVVRARRPVPGGGHSARPVVDHLERLRYAASDGDRAGHRC